MAYRHHLFQIEVSTVGMVGRKIPVDMNEKTAADNDFSYISWSYIVWQKKTKFKNAPGLKKESWDVNNRKKEKIEINNLEQLVFFVTQLL